MFTRPADLADDVVCAVVTEAWEIAIRQIDYTPAGFGSYHWNAWTDEDRWFITVDDLLTGRFDLGASPAERARRLAGALCSARCAVRESCAMKDWPSRTAAGWPRRLLRRSAHGRHEAGPTLSRIARPSSSGRVNCGQWPVGRST